MSRIPATFGDLPGTVRGAIWMILACLAFAGMAVMIRILAGGLPPLEIGFFRSFVALLLMTPFAMRTGSDIWRSDNHKAYAARGVIAAIFVMLFFSGVALIEVADA